MLCYLHVCYVTCTCVMLRYVHACYVMLHARVLCYVMLYARLFYREVFFESKSVTSIWALGSSRIYVKLTYI